MKIDLRNVYTQWVNLDEKTDNAQYMQSIFDKYGFENTHRFSAVKKMLLTKMFVPVRNTIRALQSLKLLV